jgi:hypothetical protein
MEALFFTHLVGSVYTYSLLDVILICPICTRLYVSLFLANFEISVMSTSLIAITDDLKEFNKSNWIVTAYLVTYTG